MDLDTKTEHDDWFQNWSRADPTYWKKYIKKRSWYGKPKIRYGKHVCCRCKTSIEHLDKRRYLCDECEHWWDVYVQGRAPTLDNITVAYIQWQRYNYEKLNGMSAKEKWRVFMDERKLYFQIIKRADVQKPDGRSTNDRVATRIAWREANRVAQVKPCGHCRKWKPFSEFHKDSTRADGLHNWCKKCRKRRFDTVT